MKQHGQVAGDTPMNKVGEGAMTGQATDAASILDQTPTRQVAPPSWGLGSQLHGAIGRLASFAELGILLAWFVLAGVLTAVTPYFLTETNLLNVSRQMAIVAIVAVGMSYLIISREFDLSVGSTYGLAGIGAGLLVRNVGVNIWLAVAIMLCVGALIGLINGLMVTKVGIPSFIVTLGMLSLLRGVALVLANGWPVSDLPPASFFDVFGGRLFGRIPMQTLWMMAVLLVGGFVLSKTLFGYHVYATGGNRDAARLMGIDTDRVKIINFVVAGTLAAFGGLISLAFLNSVTPTAGTGLELDIIAAVVIGGTALAGGAGSILGTFLGAAILSTVRNGLVLLGVSAYWQQAAIGLVIVIAVTLDVLSTKRRRL
jgi:simple sugar transport system permease protein/ribose transport system permease protein